MTNWKPIATAPRDGTPVLLWVDSGRWGTAEAITARWYQPGGRPGPYENWALLQTGGYAEDDEVYGTPTHWMELPDPPIAPD